MPQTMARSACPDACLANAVKQNALLPRISTNITSNRVFVSKIGPRAAELVAAIRLKAPVAKQTQPCMRKTQRPTLDESSMAATSGERGLWLHGWYHF